MVSLPEQATKPIGNRSQLLANKVVIVTGAGGAIGSAIAYTCALHGAKKDSIMILNLDVSDEQSVVDRWKTIDVLVNKYVEI